MSSDLEDRKMLTFKEYSNIFYKKKGAKMKKFYAGIILGKEDLKESNRSRIELEYYKISRRTPKIIGKKTNLYGIEIIKKEYLGNKKYKEKNNIQNLTTDENVINNLLNILRKNRVTPITLNDVIEEVL